MLDDDNGKDINTINLDSDSILSVVCEVGTLVDHELRSDSLEI